MEFRPCVVGQIISAGFQFHIWPGHAIGASNRFGPSNKICRQLKPKSLRIAWLITTF